MGLSPLLVEGDTGDITIVFHLTLVSSTGELGRDGYLGIEGAGGGVL